MSTTLSAWNRLRLKIILKCLRYTGTKRFFPIQNGLLKGKLFNVHSDNDIFYGSYEDDAIRKIKAFANKNPGAVYFDIGAHYGFYSILFTESGAGKIFAFEPDRSNFDTLLETIKLNKLQAVITFNKAVANTGQLSVSFSQTKLAASNTFVKSSMLGDNVTTTATIAVSIDEFVATEKNVVPGFIKIDVEGAEYEVLQGGLNTLRQFQPYVLLATHDCHLPGVKENCINLLTSIGYSMEKLSDPKALEGLEDFFCIPPFKSL